MIDVKYKVIYSNTMDEVEKDINNFLQKHIIIINSINHIVLFNKIATSFFYIDIEDSEKQKELVKSATKTLDDYSYIAKNKDFLDKEFF